MLDFSYFFLIGVLYIIFYQDIKNREIHVILPILIFSLSLVVNYFSIDLNFNSILYNVAFILINTIGLILYFSLKAREFTNPIDKSIGLGDLIFLLGITPLFNFKAFVLFFILGLIFSLILYGTTRVFKKTFTIPLAGYLSIFLIINVIIKNVFNINVPY
ncbi:hypothetical protein D7030_08345 [Flavobacteriaceae bacterium AU392]|nr:hypothetical protein D1817_00070 [Flavobacteriaceae bacterium]RKM85129.1 hypothetical protein D7030_08345 [Flavobacteriaceae bacterium AU392]